MGGFSRICTRLYGTLSMAALAAALAGCSASGDDDAADGAGSGGAAAPLTGGSTAVGSGGTGGVGTGGASATGGGTGGSVATGSGGVGGAGGAGGAPASGTGGVPAMLMDAGAADAAVDAGTVEDAGGGGRGADPPFETVYRIALRVHRGDSDLTDDELVAVLDEMNWIWWSQAAICFEVEVVTGEQIMQTGFDFWFHKDEIACSPGANGVYCSDHDIHTLDRPNLGPTDDPVWDTVHDPSRTSAHELGHGLTLEHYNGFADSNDSLMSSGRQGFKLHDDEIAAARMRADQKKLDDTGALYCDAPAFSDP